MSRSWTKQIEGTNENNGEGLSNRMLIGVLLILRSIACEGTVPHVASQMELELEAELELEP